MLKLTKPRIWESEASFIASLLLPLSVPYFLYQRLRSLFVKTEILSAKVICVGNAVVGGTGKTPTAIKIAYMLKELSPEKRVAFVSKGYRGLIRNPTRVDLQIHDAKQVGDEPLLLAAHAPCYIGNDRLKTCKKAIEDGFEILILDDGLHDARIAKDLSLLMVDGGFGFGNRMPLPAGPLRDRIDFAAKNVQAAIIIGKDEKKAKAFIELKLNPTPLVILADFESNDVPKAERYVAFAGIGRPAKFFKTLEKRKYNVVETISYPDHYYYTEEDEEDFKDLAKKYQANLITTEKDAIKLSAKFKDNVEVLKVSISLNEQPLKTLLKKVVS